MHNFASDFLPILAISAAGQMPITRCQDADKKYVTSVSQSRRVNREVALDCSRFNYRRCAAVLRSQLNNQDIFFDI